MKTIGMILLILILGVSGGLVCIGEYQKASTTMIIALYIRIELYISYKE